MMSSEGVSSSDDSISAKYDKRHSLSDTTVCSEQSSQRLSPVPSCTSMKSDQSMDPPARFSSNFSDGHYSTDQRVHSASLQKRLFCKSRSRHACVCGETCSARTHNRMHAQPCSCCGGIVTPCCMRQNLTAASEQDAAKPVHEDGPQRGNRSTWLFWILSLLIGLLCVAAAVTYFMSSSKMQEVKTAGELSLMLLGRSGAGKSASGNTILGRPAFEEDYSFLPVTKGCETRSAVILGRKVKITDTPGLSDESFVNCFANDSTIHAFLVVIRLGRITVEEKENIRHIAENFGSGALKHALVLFTGGDLLGGKSFTELLAHSPPILKEILRVCGGGYHVFNNKDRSDIRQVEELLLKIEAIMYRNGVYKVEAPPVEHEHDVKNVPEHTETFYVVFILGVVFLAVDGVRVLLSSLVVLVRNVYASKTKVSKQNSCSTQTEPEETDEFEDIYMTDEMKEIRQTKKM
ncbi:GTPase IMAP family member 8-like isoform X2 [Colossoma macropomum]|uniref:GTPase IMAP family member 8-like isoform X2 n=1 Tax=Colossoma macropomum TaxID=42526 RepID=UPI00186548FE|nr:GTPase IMAP family member 8-like isoform X2 [Colossoma macropomum]